MGTSLLTKSKSPLTIESHFMHPDHPLHLVDIDVDFECDGCNGPCHSRRYRCFLCTGEHLFDLHEQCATCPSSLSCDFHPIHSLTLVVSHISCGPCALCGDDVLGLHYTCSSGPAKGCTFNIHPLCTELPTSVHHALHPHHLLTLQPSSSGGCCLACSCPCLDRWRYRCAPCGVEAHLECAFGQSPQQRQRAVMGQPAAATSPVFSYYLNGCSYVVPAGVPNPYTAYNPYAAYNLYTAYNPYTAYNYNMYQPALNYYYYQGQTGNYNHNYQQGQQQQQWPGCSTSSSSNSGSSIMGRICSIVGTVALQTATAAIIGAIF
ncbi:hypothetical protein CDL15_Pgr025866 [Punica granatum]|nr:hypothetical protein CDL15_Pgr025866 [Punica granatum]